MLAVEGWCPLGHHDVTSSFKHLETKRAAI